MSSQLSPVNEGNEAEEASTGDSGGGGGGGDGLGLEDNGDGHEETPAAADTQVVQAIFVHDMRAFVDAAFKPYSDKDAGLEQRSALAVRWWTDLNALTLGVPQTKGKTKGKKVRVGPTHAIPSPHLMSDLDLASFVLSHLVNRPPSFCTHLQVERLGETINKLGLNKTELRQSFKDFVDELDEKAKILTKWHMGKGAFPDGYLNGKVVRLCFKRHCEDVYEVS